MKNLTEAALIALVAGISFVLGAAWQESRAADEPPLDPLWSCVSRSEIDYLLERTEDKIKDFVRIECQR